MWRHIFCFSTTSSRYILNVFFKVISKIKMKFLQKKKKYTLHICLELELKDTKKELKDTSTC